MSRPSLQTAHTEKVKTAKSDPRKPRKKKKVLLKSLRLTYICQYSFGLVPDQVITAAKAYRLPRLVLKEGDWDNTYLIAGLRTWVACNLYAFGELDSAARDLQYYRVQTAADTQHLGAGCKREREEILIT